MAKLLHIFYHKEGTFSLLCQQVQLITVSSNCRIGFHNNFSYGVRGVIHFFIKYNNCCIQKQKDA